MPAAGGHGSVTWPPNSPPSRQPRLIREPLRVVSDDELENIHRASMRVLAEIGIDFLLPEARRLLADAGATVDSESARVRFDPELDRVADLHRAE